MTTFRQTSDGDLALEAGRLVLIKGDEEKRQQIENKLSIATGEWFLNLLEGVPYYEDILGIKDPNLEVIRRTYRQIILSVEGIEDVSLTVALNAERELEYSFVAITDDGTEITGGSKPFILGSAS